MEEMPEVALTPKKDPYIGQKIGNLCLIEQIGVGGFGSVYRAEHEKLRTSFAIKILHLQLQGSSNALERFQREAFAIAQLSHPNVIRVMDFGNLDNGGYYLVMDYLRGQTLEEFLQSGQRPTLLQIQDILLQICGALHYIHHKGIVHRDLKPANIYLEQKANQEYPRVKLFDFGIASLEEDVSLTRTGVCMGSPLYMSPEQAIGETKNADARTDLYSTGIILYELLAGFPPFQGSVKSVMYKQVHEKPRKLKQVRPHIKWSGRLEAVLQKVMEKEPKDRYESAKAFGEALTSAITSQLSRTPDGILFLNQENERDEGTGQDYSVSMTKKYGPASPARRSQAINWKILLLTALIALFLGAGLWNLFSAIKPKKDKRILAPIAHIRPALTIQKKPTKQAKPLKPSPKIKRVKVIIHSQPQANAWQKGKNLGHTPQTLVGKPGQHFTLTLKAQGFQKRVLQGQFSNQQTVYKKVKLIQKRIQPRSRRAFDIDDPI